jgi:xylan 1,4-beta-xylosidase
MSLRIWGCACLLLAACNDLFAADVAFDWFEYTGKDSVFNESLPPGSYRNPVLAGFYPDPSITRVGGKFYLVNSSFGYFPGIPIFESADLVHWNQLGHVIDRPSQLNLNGIGISRGVFAPSIDFHAGSFYVTSTAVDSGGNFFVTASNPAGPWSDPQWLPEIDGIDPSFFFDGDKAYIVNNGPPEGATQYEGHRAIWMQEFDLARRKLVGPRKVLVNGGANIAKRPIWIEGPHLFKRSGWYYLTCAEGGTGEEHSEVVLRSRSPWGPFEPFADNPILTQRDLPATRDRPIANAGHAQLIEAADGTWWATFLASRPYDEQNFNTGRETYLLPVTWRNEWPIILEKGRAIPYVMKGPSFMTDTMQRPFTGNFTWRDEFDGPTLDHSWMQLRTPQQPWFDLSAKRGRLTVQALPMTLDSLQNPAFLAFRQQHQAFEATTSFEVASAAGVSAGIAAFQNENYWYFFGARRSGRQVELFIEKKGGQAVSTITSSTLDLQRRVLQLRIIGTGKQLSFAYSSDGKRWSTLRGDVDGSILSTAVAGGFVGAVVGPYARAD